jgi:hypothetical protein
VRGWSNLWVFPRCFVCVISDQTPSKIQKSSASALRDWQRELHALLVMREVHAWLENSGLYPEAGLRHTIDFAHVWGMGGLIGDRAARVRKLGGQNTYETWAASETHSHQNTPTHARSFVVCAAVRELALNVHTAQKRGGLPEGPTFLIA